MGSENIVRAPSLSSTEIEQMNEAARPSNKDYSEQTVEELRADLKSWTRCVDDATGWASAYFAAKQVEVCVRWLARRGVTVENPRPIRVGGEP